MYTLTNESAETRAASWRSGAAADSPAGPLYTAGRFAEADIAAPGRALTRLSCAGRTACTADHSQCC